MISLNLPHLLPGSSSSTAKFESNNSPLSNVFDFVLRLFGR